MKVPPFSPNNSNPQECIPITFKWKLTIGEPDEPSLVSNV